MGERSDRVGRGVGPRLALGFVVGPLVGAAVGVLLGLLIFGAGSRGMWASLIAGAIFGALGGFWGGMSGLGPPDETDDPLPRADGDEDGDLDPGRSHVP